MKNNHNNENRQHESIKKCILTVTMMMALTIVATLLLFLIKYYLKIVQKSKNVYMYVCMCVPECVTYIHCQVMSNFLKFIQHKNK